MKKHKHHIIPKHAGGDDSANNIIELTVEEHAEAHRLLFEKYGRIQDKVAYMGLASLATHAELIYMLNSEGKKGNKNPMFGKPAPNRGVKRPGIGGRKKGTTWSDSEYEIHRKIRSAPGYYDFTKDPERGRKISEATKGRTGPSTGKTWFNNGETEMYGFDCPDGFLKGRLPGRISNKKGLLWFNNGLMNKQFKENMQPEGFVRGRISKK
jgi:hypothetical protein